MNIKKILFSEKIIPLLFFISAIGIVYYQEVYLMKKDMFIDGKDLYCKNNIVVNQNNGWEFNKKNNYFVKNNYHINVDDCNIEN